MPLLGAFEVAECVPPGTGALSTGSRVMCVAGEASVLLLSFQGIILALCRLFPLSEDGRGLSPSAALH